MDIIQMACESLSRHDDLTVSSTALEIAAADLRRESDYEKVCAQKDAVISTMSAKIRVTNAELRRCKDQLATLKLMIFAQSSEKTGSLRTADKAETLSGNATDSDEAEDEAEDGFEPGSITAGQVTDAPRRTSSGKRAVKLPENIPREIEVHEPPSTSCDCCGCQATVIGVQIVEKVGFRPARVVVTEQRFPKYKCLGCKTFFQAKVPDQAFDFTRYGPELRAGIATSKFADFLPLFRIEQIFERSGAKIHRGTLSRLMTSTVEALEPIYEALLEDVRASGKLHMDETRMPQLVPGNGKVRSCYAWALCRDDRRWLGNLPAAVVFGFAQSRAGEHGERLLGDFRGVLQVDGFPGYNRLTSEGRPNGPIKLTYCWSHVRRHFRQLWLSTKSKAAKHFFDQINARYGIEQRIAGTPASHRLSVRKRETVPLAAELKSSLEKTAASIAMKSSLGEAINYTLKLWDGLVVFLSDGRLEMDNNPVENAIRPIALLRKNALFAGSEVGGRNWAIMASLVGTCKLHGVEPYAYFTWVFEQLAKKLPRSEYHKLMPWYCPKGRYKPKE